MLNFLWHRGTINDSNKICLDRLKLPSFAWQAATRNATCGASGTLVA